VMENARHHPHGRAREKNVAVIDRAIDAAITANKPDARALCLAILRSRLDAVKARLAAGTTGLDDKVRDRAQRGRAVTELSGGGREETHSQKEEIRPNYRHI